jgi:hypothetical protein
MISVIAIDKSDLLFRKDAANSTFYREYTFIDNDFLGSNVAFEMGFRGLLKSNKPKDKFPHLLGFSTHENFTNILRPVTVELNLGVLDDMAENN